MREVVVYLPAADSRWARGIRRGSAIVCAMEPAPDGRIAVDYEGAIYGQSAMKSFADRVQYAAGRSREHHPTVARVWVEPQELRRIGSFDETWGEVILDNPGAAADLAAWLETDGLPISELQAGGMKFELRRQLATERASGDPRRIAAANEAARRMGLERD